MSSLRKLIGERIRYIRKLKGLTQEELSEKAQIRYTYLSDVERGDRNASLDSLEKIIRALDIQTSDLFDFSELHVDQTNLELKDTLEVHYNFLKSKNIEDVKMIHRITKEIFKSIESK
ncbi:helix-turn-helix domain-containing protein [Paenibacillus sp. OAS669]|uniref:helix-turn-helix domain-containing protein n=1 Tax=Paenibacillus sp. OAS669 TaxID=2663821 RepID=UPI001789FAB5|nr:helix-turn-helix transcriptional regulator [Paenibacillus sp. OAS669]MBE1446137.1 transcriptional regulator with XRE-family HTH domain [Paenibacillus sp. OAS669]